MEEAVVSAVEVEEGRRDIGFEACCSREEMYEASASSGKNVLRSKVDEATVETVAGVEKMLTSKTGEA
jgi:hypothetical protein